MGLLTPEMAAPLTARVSALVFAAALIAPSLSPWAARRSAGLFLAFIAAHTVHFSAVAWLALVSGGKNLPAGGSWPLVLIEALLFYALAWTALRARRAGHDASCWLRRADVVATVIISLIFLGAYVPRTARSAWFALPAGLVAVGLAGYLLRLRSGTIAPSAVQPLFRCAARPRLPRGCVEAINALRLPAVPVATNRGHARSAWIVVRWLTHRYIPVTLLECSSHESSIN